MWTTLAADRASVTDFADGLIGETNRARGVATTATFDKDTGLLAGIEAI